MSYQTNTSLTVAANDIFGAIKQRAQLGIYYFKNVEKAVVKATNLSIVVPKNKHVQCTDDQYTYKCAYDSFAIHQ